jgi:hypothetical protein
MPTTNGEYLWPAEVNEPQGEPENELAAFDEFSIWKQGAEADGAAPDDRPHEEEQAPALPEESFINRYAHLFAEDDESNGETPPRPAAHAPAPDDFASQPPSTAAAQTAAPQPPADGEEETIEQYMAKLLQRVRGGAPYTPEPTTLKRPDQRPTERHTEPRSAPGAESNPPSASPAEEEQVTTSLGTVRRKSTVVEPPANLEAFRALANESARRAIGTYALRIHRRNAITKTIVAILSGMTSVWLMLEAPNLRDLQFISACVFLLIAAYWAGQTCGSLLEAFHAASYDGPQTTAGDPDDPFRPALPIDVEQGSREPGDKSRMPEHTGS